MDVAISIQNVVLRGRLEIPSQAKSLVIFAHNSGKESLPERSSIVAMKLRNQRMGTLMIDLLTEKESKDYESGFKIEILTERLIAVTKWCLENEKTKKLALSYFGDGTEAASTLSAAAYWGTKIKAVVSYSGRPDLAMDVLDLIESPTLLIVGGEDKQVVDLNRQAYQKIGAIKKMEIIDRTTHLFEESGVMAKVAELTKLWFTKYL